MKLLRNQTGESLPLCITWRLLISTKRRLPILYVTSQYIYTPSIVQTRLVAELTRATLVADAFVDAVVASVRASTSNDTGIASIFNNQPGWSKDSIMQITFGIVGTMLGVAAVWLSVYPGVRRYRELIPLFSKVVG
jgi:hypothetical protein